MILILLSLLFVVWEVDGVFATHLPAEVENTDLSKMEKIFSDDANAILILKDPLSQNIFIKYGIFSVNDSGVREFVKEELAVKVPATKIQPLVQSRIDKIEDGSFRYVYTVSNGREARQPIWYFELVDLQNVGNLSSPVMWGAEPSTAKWPHTGWANMEKPPKVHAIGPGQKLDGFGIEDKRLPGIMKSCLIGKPTRSEMALRGFHDEPPVILERVMNQILHTDTFRYVNVKTVGPAFEKPTDPSVICDTFILDLIGQVRDAEALGWIKHDLRKDRDDDDDRGKSDDKGKKKGHDKDDDNEGDNGDDSDLDDADKRLSGVAKSIIKKLTKVRRECLRGKLGAAREKLRVLIKQVNAQRGKHLTEEAYALIRFNAEFLLEKL